MPGTSFVPILTIGAQCMDASFALLKLWLSYMHSTGHVPYAPDFFFVGTGFAGAFLLEVCRLSYLRFGASSPGHYSILFISFSARTPPRRCLPNSAHRLSMCARSSWRSCGRPLLTTRMHRTRMLSSSKAHCKRPSWSLRCPLLQPDWQETEPVFLSIDHLSCLVANLFTLRILSRVLYYFICPACCYMYSTSLVIIDVRSQPVLVLHSLYTVRHCPSLAHTHLFIPPSPRDPSLDVSLYLLILSMPAWKYLFFFSKTYDHDITLFMHRLD